MRLAIEILDEASTEIGDATEWYEERRVGLGLVFVSAVDRAIDQIARWPFAGSLVDDVDPKLEVRRTRIDRFPYYAAYLVYNDSATVLAIGHDRRRPNYWIDRVR